MNEQETARRAVAEVIHAAMSECDENPADCSPLQEEWEVADRVLARLAEVGYVAGPEAKRLRARLEEAESKVGRVAALVDDGLEYDGIHYYQVREALEDGAGDPPDRL